MADEGSDTKVYIHGLKYEVDELFKQACFYMEDIEETSETVHENNKQFLWQSQKWNLTLYDETKLPYSKKQNFYKRKISRRAKIENEGQMFDVMETVISIEKENDSATTHLREYTWRPKHVNTEESYILVTFLNEESETRKNDFTMHNVSTSYVANVTHQDFQQTYNEDDDEVISINEHLEQPVGALARLTYLSEKLLHVDRINTDLDEDEEAIEVYEIHPINVTISYEPTQLWVQPYEGKYGLSTSHFQLSERFGSSCESRLLKVTTRAGYLSDFSTSLSEVKQIKKYRKLGELQTNRYNDLPDDTIVIDKLDMKFKHIKESVGSESDDEGFEDIELSFCVPDYIPQKSSSSKVDKDAPEYLSEVSVNNVDILTSNSSGITEKDIPPHETKDALLNLSTKDTQQSTTNFHTDIMLEPINKGIVDNLVLTPPIDSTDTTDRNTDTIITSYIDTNHPDVIIPNNTISNTSFDLNFEIQKTISRACNDEIIEAKPFRIGNQTLPSPPTTNDLIVKEISPLTIDFIYTPQQRQIVYQGVNSSHQKPVLEDLFTFEVKSDKTSGEHLETLENVSKVHKKGDSLPSELSHFEIFNCKGITDGKHFYQIENVDDEKILEKPNADKHSSVSSFKTTENIDVLTELNILPVGVIFASSNVELVESHEKLYLCTNPATEEEIKDVLVNDSFSYNENIFVKNCTEEELNLTEEVGNNTDGHLTLTEEDIPKLVENYTDENLILTEDKILKDVSSNSQPSLAMQQNVSNVIADFDLHKINESVEDNDHKSQHDTFLIDTCSTDHVTEHKNVSKIYIEKQIESRQNTPELFQDHGLVVECDKSDRKKLVAEEDIFPNKTQVVDLKMPTLEGNLEETTPSEQVIVKEDLEITSLYKSDEVTPLQPSLIAAGISFFKKNAAEVLLETTSLDTSDVEVTPSLVTNNVEIASSEDETKTTDIYLEIHHKENIITKIHSTEDTQNDMAFNDKQVNSVHDFSISAEVTDISDERCENEIIVEYAISKDVEYNENNLKFDESSGPLNSHINGLAITSEDILEEHDLLQSPSCDQNDDLSDDSDSEDASTEVGYILTGKQNSFSDVGYILTCKELFEPVPDSEVDHSLNGIQTSAGEILPDNEHIEPESSSEIGYILTGQKYVEPTTKKLIEDEISQKIKTSLNLKIHNDNMNDYSPSEDNPNHVIEKRSPKKTLKSKAKTFIRKSFKKSDDKVETKKERNKLTAFGKIKSQSSKMIRRISSGGKVQNMGDEKETLDAKFYSTNKISAASEEITTHVSEQLELFREKNYFDGEDLRSFTNFKRVRSKSVDSLLDCNRKSSKKGQERNERRRRLAGYTFINNQDKFNDVVKGRDYSFEVCTLEREKEIHFINEQRKHNRLSEKSKSMDIPLQSVEKVKTIGRIKIPKIFRKKSSKHENSIPRSSSVGKLEIPKAFSVENICDL